MCKRTADGVAVMESPVFEYVDPSYRTRLNTAIETNDIQLLLSALKSGVSVRLPDNSGWTPLHIAAKFDRTELMKLMLKKDVEAVNLKTHAGRTPLAVCCEMNSYDTSHFLLSQKHINVNCVDNDIASALHIACSKGHLQIVKTLIDHGALVNAKEISGFTPLHEAVVNNKLEICQYLLSHGADPLIKDSDNGLYPFHFACQNGNLPIVKLLLDDMKGFSIDTTGSDGRTALMISIMSRNVEIVEELFKRGADANIADERHIIALHIAASIGCFEIFKLIYQHTSAETISKYCTLDRVPKTGAVDCKGQSLITLAITTNDFDFLKSVLNFVLDRSVLNCPFILAHTPTYLYTPISFLLHNELVRFNHNTVKCLNLLIESGSPLSPTSRAATHVWLDPLSSCILSFRKTNRPFVLECAKILLQKQPIVDILNQKLFRHFELAVEVSRELVLLLLQHSDVVEPLEVLYCWLNLRHYFTDERYITSQDTVCMLLDFIPERVKTMKLLSDVTPMPASFSQKHAEVPSLSVICRYAIRNQLHRETINNPSLFREKRKNLPLPKSLLNFINYM